MGPLTSRNDAYMENITKGFTNRFSTASHVVNVASGRKNPVQNFSYPSMWGLKNNLVWATLQNDIPLNKRAGAHNAIMPL